jgi:hypothetical protein
MADFPGQTTPDGRPLTPVKHMKIVNGQPEIIVEDETPRRRRAALLELGVRERLPSNTAGNGRGLCYLAKAKALAVGLSNAYFKCKRLTNPC